MSMLLSLLADTHEMQDEVEVPTADILIVAGDWTMLSRSVLSIRAFNHWLGGLPHKRKLLIPGNHEFYLEEDERRRDLTPNGTILLNQGVEIEGLRIWGSPVTPLYGGAFGLSSPKDRVRHWARIPEDTHVLVTHGPPLGILDRSSGQEEHQGDPELLDAIKRLKQLRLHVFGHIHGAHGFEDHSDVVFTNVSLLGTDWRTGTYSFRM